LSEASSLEDVLSEAKEKEKQYEWMKAAQSYRKALTLAAESDFLRKGQISESLAYAVYKTAFQANSGNEFKERMTQAKAHYEEVKAYYERAGDTEKGPRISRCDAMIAFAGYWLASKGSERKKLIEDTWRHAKTALESFDAAKNPLEYGKTFTQLSLSLTLQGWVEFDYDANTNTVNEGVKCGEQAVASLSRLGDPFQLAKAYAQTAVYMEQLAMGAPDPAEKETFSQKAQSYSLKARQLSEEAASLESYWYVGWNVDESLVFLARALDYARKTKDHFTIGWVLTYLSMNTVWKTQIVEDAEERCRLLNKALNHAENAKNEFSKLSWISPTTGSFWVEAPHTEYFYRLASDETEPHKRRDLLHKAVDSAPEGFRLAEESGVAVSGIYMHQVLSRAILSLARTETDLQKRMKMLQEGLEHRKESSKFNERNNPFGYGPLGLDRNYMADIKCQIADLTADSNDRMNVIQEAIRLKEEALSLYSKDLKGYRSDDKAMQANLGSFQFEYAEMLNRLYALTGNKEHFANAVEALRQAADTFQKLSLMSRSAECWWRSAQAYDARGEYSKAAEHFELASKDYHIASDNIPKLKDFYEDHALYMKAWTEIEKGRHHHERQEYGVAEEHFRKAAELHRASTRWSYLAPSYAAWANVECAEELSRKEHDEEAFEGFQQSLDFLEEAKRSIETALGRIDDSNEKQMATTMIKATELRLEYCKTRMTIEEAKILDKKGEHHSSAKQYGSAVETLEKLIQKLESQPDIRECQFIACLSRAWQKMEEAEAEESPEHYDEAAQLFEKAKDLGQSEKTKALVLGHSRFCKALEAGAKFADTGDMTEHAKAMQHLESATTFYLKADFQSASEYTKATRSLFDAYVHMGNAARETDPEKKTRLYTVAQKILQASADSYAKAGNPSRKEQALKLLQTANEQRELAISLAEVLHAPIMASTTAFAAPSPTSEKAVGLERFEHAEITANLILNSKELRVGESAELEIELANPGKGQALLNQIERAIPEGFELTVKPEPYRVEGCNINLKGKRLQPLKTEEVKLIMKPKRKGSFTVGPRITYLDENGNTKSHEPRPLTITVKELGIRGWIKGEA
jgi:tetratricopeptide (TPR) repeat protein